MNSDLHSTLEKILVQKAMQVNQPIYACLELLPLCNMNCDMCYVRLNQKELKERGRLRTVDEWLDLAEQMKEMGTLFVLLTGGEPLLYPDFKRVYQTLIEIGMIVTINTNGTLLDEEWADFFGRYKPRRINVTIYGSDDLTYQKLCHYTGGFQKAIHGIKLLKKKGVAVKINGSLTTVNMAQMDDIYKIGKILDCPVHIDTYMVSCIRERNKSFHSEIRLSPEKAAVSNIQALQKEMSNKDFQKYIEETIFQIENSERDYDRTMSCLAGKCSFAVNWQGEMRPCLTFTNLSTFPFEVGVKKAWDQLVDLSSQLFLNEKCSKCKLRTICKTCVASAFCETGAFDGISPYHCHCAETYFKLISNEYADR